jgi:PAS domain S-box-containing protein
VVSQELQIERELSRITGPERAERLASLLTLSSEAMLVWDLDEGIEFWNSGAERLYGFTSEEAVIEAELRKTEEQLQFLGSIVQSSDDAIVSKNLNGMITSWNKGAERIFGYTAEEAIGQPITIVIPHDRQDEERTILTRIRRGETIRQRKHGSLIAVSLTISYQRHRGQDRRSVEDR